MKTILLAGGFGTRLSERTHALPKPMVEIGGFPILWHVMQIYSSHGYDDFVVACGYRGEVIKKYFADLRVKCTDFTLDLASGDVRTLRSESPRWRVTLVETGLNTMTGGRIQRLRHLMGGEPFMVTYGDGVGDVDLRALVSFHRAHGRLATVTAVRPAARFGALRIERGEVREFCEKPQSAGGWVNGGFFVFEPGVFEYLGGDETSLESEPLERLSRDRQLMAYQHEGYWQPMDTLRDQKVLEKQWNEGRAPWKTW